MKKQPQRSEQQEWKVIERTNFCELHIGKDSYTFHCNNVATLDAIRAIRDAHNAALAAEREKLAEHIEAANEVTDENIELEEQLAAERQRREQAEREVRKPLAEALRLALPYVPEEVAVDIRRTMHALSVHKKPASSERVT